jgi:hypothetical protein
MIARGLSASRPSTGPESGGLAAGRLPVVGPPACRRAAVGADPRAASSAPAGCHGGWPPASARRRTGSTAARATGRTTAATMVHPRGELCRRPPAGGPVRSQEQHPVASRAASFVRRSIVSMGMMILQAHRSHDARSRKLIHSRRAGIQDSPLRLFHAGTRRTDMTEAYEAARGSDGLACWWGGPVVMPLVFVAVTCAAGLVGGVR